MQAFLAFQQAGEPGDAGAAGITFSQLVDQTRLRAEIVTAWERYFEEVDVFVCPVSATPAFPHDSRPFDLRTVTTSAGERPYHEQAFWVSHAALAGLPTVAAPVGRAPGGLPVGAQLIGPSFEDDTVITFAELLAEVVGGYERPPL